MAFIEQANSKHRVWTRQLRSRSFKLVIKRSMIFPEMTLIDRTILYLEYIAITPKSLQKKMTTTYTPALGAVLCLTI